MGAEIYGSRDIWEQIYIYIYIYADKPLATELVEATNHQPTTPEQH